MRIILPSYFYATDPAWDTLIKSNNGQVLVVLNPHNGPGESVDENYLKLCTRLRKARIGMMGYVATGWGKRHTSDVTNDIESWNARYGLRDIFFDEVETGLDKLEYYKNLYNWVDGLVVLNHGAIPDEAYLQCGDILVIFESTYAKHSLVKFPNWMRRHRKKRFCQIIHSAPDWPMAKRALAKASETSEFVYVTDDTEVPDDNPYDLLPTYWNKELKACR